MAYTCPPPRALSSPPQREARDMSTPLLFWAKITLRLGLVLLAVGLIPLLASAIPAPAISPDRAGAAERDGRPPRRHHHGRSCAYSFPGSAGSAAAGIFLIRSRAITTSPAPTITAAPSSDTGSIRWPKEQHAQNDAPRQRGIVEWLQHARRRHRQRHDHQPVRRNAGEHDVADTQRVGQIQRLPVEHADRRAHDQPDERRRKTCSSSRCRSAETLRVSTI